MTAQGEDILAYLDSAITTREQTAKAATQGPWEMIGIGDFGWTVSTSRPNGAIETDDSEQGLADATHIALNDPASVLRRCAADRKVIALHQPDGWTCKVCANEEQSDEDSEGEYHWSRPGLAFPCPTIEALAEGYGWTEEAS